MPISIFNLMYVLVTIVLVSESTTTVVSAATMNSGNNDQNDLIELEDRVIDNENTDDSVSDQIKIQSRSAIIGWRFKKINGNAYKRQFNYSADKWIGKWVQV